VRRVVSDTGPLLHLTEAEAMHLLQWVGDLHAPPQVVAEMAYHLPAWRVPEWMTIGALVAPHAAEAAAWQQTGLLDAGEAEAIALARQIKADWLLTDDSAARLFAAELGLEVHGSLGVVLGAAALGHIDQVEAERALTELAASSLWISRRVLVEARAALDEIFR
jgi:predicted nucleic acid-binding protein